MKLGLDLDGVVVDFAGHANRYLADVTGEYVDPTEWDWYRQYTDGERHWRRLWNVEIRKGGYLRACPPVAGALVGVLIASHDHDVTFVTHRPVDVAGDTRIWLDRHGLAFPVVHTKNKHEAGCDLYLDDKPKNVEDLRRRGANAVLFKQPWNRDYWLSLPSVAGWSEFLMGLNGWMAA